MPEITDTLRHLIDDSDWGRLQDIDLFEFAEDSIREYDERQLLVDAEWLEAYLVGDEWETTQELRRTIYRNTSPHAAGFYVSCDELDGIEIGFIRSGEHCIKCQGVTRGDILDLLGIVGESK